MIALRIIIILGLITLWLWLSAKYAKQVFEELREAWKDFWK